MKLVIAVLGLSVALFLATFPAVAQSDTQPPTLTAFDFNPKAVDVTGGPASVTCQISAHDALSGVRHIACGFRSPRFQTTSCTSYAPDAGTIYDGMWSCSAPFNQYAESGEWDVIVVDCAIRTRIPRRRSTP